MSEPLIARASARRRHPSVRSPVPVDVVAGRVAEAVAGSGAPWPEVAVAILADRGATGLDLADYARSLGVPAPVLARAEAGSLAPGDLPAPLLRVVAAAV